MMRLRLAFAVIGVGLALASIACTQEIPSGFQVAIDRGNLQRTGVYNSQAVKEFHQVVWKSEAPSGASSPTIASDLTLFGTCDVTMPGGYCTKGSLRALDAKTGQERWAFETKGYVASPTVSGSLIYFGSSDHNFYALDLKTGEEKWRFETNGEIYTSPLVSDGIVYFASDTTDYQLYAIDAKTGHEKWRYDPHGRILTNIALYKGRVIFGAVLDLNLNQPDRLKGRIFSLDASNGQEVWSFDLENGVFSGPAIANDVLFFVENDREKEGLSYNYFSQLYALDVATGKQIWKHRIKEWARTSPAVWENTVYLVSDEGLLYAVDSTNGSVKWTFETRERKLGMGPFTLSNSSSPSIASDVVYFATSFNNGMGFPCINEGTCPAQLYAVDAVTGEEKWTFGLGWGTQHSPIISNGILYITADRGIGIVRAVYAIE